jgi:hypothetical protein
MQAKPKTPQLKSPFEVQTRDFFQTPRYATQLLVPYIPKTVRAILEPACGNMKIVNALRENNYHVVARDLLYGHNFFETHFDLNYRGNNTWAIITNPPFSLKKEFVNKCFECNVPFALLIPFDMNGWLAEAFRKGCQGLVPTRRIDYITPTGLEGVRSSAQFHSFWLTYGFNLPQQLTIVDLTKEMKGNI